MTFGKDHRTYELSLAILNEEIEHEAWFSEFLVDLRVTSGGVPGESPYISRFLVCPTATTVTKWDQWESRGFRVPDLPEGRAVPRFSGDSCLTRNSRVVLSWQA